MKNSIKKSLLVLMTISSLTALQVSASEAPAKVLTAAQREAQKSCAAAAKRRKAAKKSITTITKSAATSREAINKAQAKKKAEATSKSTAEKFADQQGLKGPERTAAIEKFNIKFAQKNQTTAAVVASKSPTLARNRVVMGSATLLMFALIYKYRGALQSLFAQRPRTMTEAGEMFQKFIAYLKGMSMKKLMNR